MTALKRILIWKVQSIRMKNFQENMQRSLSAPDKPIKHMVVITMSSYKRHDLLWPGYVAM